MNAEQLYEIRRAIEDLRDQVGDLCLASDSMGGEPIDEFEETITDLAAGLDALDSLVFEHWVDAVNAEAVESVKADVAKDCAQ